MKTITYNILIIFYLGIFLIGALFVGLSMIFKVFGAYLMFSPEVVEDEVRVIKRNIGL